MKRNTWCLAFAIFGAIGLQTDSSWALSDSAVKDETLESKVEQRLRMEGRIRWDELKVESDHGQVTLYGIVKSNEERGFAEKAASTVSGVSSVVNKLLVQPGMPDQNQAPNARLNEESRDRVIEGPSGLKDRQILP
jgi:BON domain-containing protein